VHATEYTNKQSLIVQSKHSSSQRCAEESACCAVAGVLVVLSLQANMCPISITSDTIENIRMQCQTTKPLSLTSMWCIYIMRVV
jgi:hypothetical protein